MMNDPHSQHLARIWDSARHINGDGFEGPYQTLDLEGHVFVGCPDRESSHVRAAVVDFNRFRGRSVLDIGCNIGVNSILARMAGADRVVGLDVSGPMVEVAQEFADCLGLAIEYKCIDFGRASDEELRSAIRDERFDYVLFFSVWDWLGRHRSLFKRLESLFRIGLLWETHELGAFKHDLLDIQAFASHYNLRCTFLGEVTPQSRGAFWRREIYLLEKPDPQTLSGGSIDHHHISQV